ncbi:MAG: lipid-A-disaccharide synthase [Pseudomonadota bacterium]|nr:lipid-A-disaccharide synthase [Pseudomonadota bacterium]
MAYSEQEPFVWLIAGEPSGDLIGGELIGALMQRTEGRVRVEGVGGEWMAANGLQSLFPISDISVMGLVEILPRISLIKRRIRDTVHQIKQDEPDLVVSIDVPGFSYDVWKGLRGTGIPLVHYVAPSVWAWRPYRAKKFAKELTHLMTLLPFEAPYFEKEGLATTFVGHPVLSGEAGNGDGTSFRQDNCIGKNALVVCVLLGSRSGEIKRLASVFREVAANVVTNFPEAVFLFPVGSSVEELVLKIANTWPGRKIVVAQNAKKFDAMAASDAAMAASGTVSLELAMARVPHVIAYRLNGLTVAIVRMLHGVNQKYVNLINILLNRHVVPEFIQSRCRQNLIAPSLLELINNPEARRRQMDEFNNALKLLLPDSGSPSNAAADVVFSILTPRRKNFIDKELVDEPD